MLKKRNGKYSISDIFPLSATKISTWKTCPFAFYLKYIEKVKVPQSVHLAFGKSVHYALEQFYKKNFKSAESFAKWWAHQWQRMIAGQNLGKERDFWGVREHSWTNKSGERIPIQFCNLIYFPQNEKDAIGAYFAYRKLGMNILQKFYEKHKALSKPFATEKRITFDFRGYKILAILDRADEHEGKKFVTDYKTDKGFPSSDDPVLLNHHQFTIYSAAFRDLFGVEESGILYYHLRSLLNDSKTSIIKTQRLSHHFDNLERVCESTFKGVEKALQDGIFDQVWDHRCRFCDYSKPCLERTTSQQGIRLLSDLEKEALRTEEFDGWIMDEER
jgi:CRISPR/Cas system-associated exonuclease Cas4 (RecB family)